MSYGRTVPPTVRVSPPRPRPWGVPVAVACGLAAGLGLVAWSIKAPPPGLADAELAGSSGGGPETFREPASPVPEERPRPEAEEAPPGEAGDGPRRASGAAGEIAGRGEEVGDSEDAEAGEEEGDEPAAEGAPVAPAVDPPAAVEADELRRVASDLVLERGRLAYIQCPGAEGSDGRCPRDMELEARVWAILEGLGGCPQWPQVQGTGDVRLHLRRDGTTLRFRDWGEAPLPLGPLQACLTPAVEGLRTSLRADPVVVSFRFRLRAR